MQIFSELEFYAHPMCMLCVDVLNEMLNDGYITRNYDGLRGRNHRMREGTRFTDAVALYYFGFDVRNILMRCICRIEVAFHTFMTYTLSNRYGHDPHWFVNAAVVDEGFADSFGSTCYEGFHPGGMFQQMLKGLSVTSGSEALDVAEE